MRIFSYVFILVILLIFVGATTNSLGSLGNYIHVIPYSDKWIHLILIGTLAYVINYWMGFRRFSLFGKKLLTGTLLISILITIEEFSQMWVPSRTFDLLDLLANYVGIFLATIVILWNEKERNYAKIGN